MQRVIDHLHAHLDEPLDLFTLADIAHLSPCHWHRVYHATYGETLAATVKRLRLHRAAGWLANTNQPVAQVAARAGYPNLQSFTRLFKAAFGLPPARYRAAGQHTAFADPQRLPDASAHPVEVRHVAPVETLTLAHRGAYMQIGHAFDILLGRLGASGQARAGMQLFGVYLDDPSVVDEADLRSRACVAGAVPGRLPAPFETALLAGGDCAVLTYTGPYASMHAAYRWLFGTWLPASGRQAADGPLIEAYLNDPRCTPPTELVTRIQLPLRAG